MMLSSSLLGLDDFQLRAQYVLSIWWQFVDRKVGLQAANNAENQQECNGAVVVD